MGDVVLDKHSLFYLDEGLFIWTLLTFAIVVAILWWKVWPIIAKGIDTRLEKIQNDLKRAKEASTRADEVGAETDRIIGEAKAEAYQIVTAAKDSANSVRDQIIEEARKQAEKIVADGRHSVDQAKRQAVEEIRRNVIHLSVDIAGKLIRRDLSEKDHQAIFDEELKRYDAM